MKPTAILTCSYCHIKFEYRPYYRRPRKYCSKRCVENASSKRFWPKYYKKHKEAILKKNRAWSKKNRVKKHLYYLKKKK